MARSLGFAYRCLDMKCARVVVASLAMAVAAAKLAFRHNILQSTRQAGDEETRMADHLDGEGICTALHSSFASLALDLPLFIVVECCCVPCVWREGWEL